MENRLEDFKRKLFTLLKEYNAEVILDYVTEENVLVIDLNSVWENGVLTDKFEQIILSENLLKMNIDELT